MTTYRLDPTVTPQQLTELTVRLRKLANTVDYQPATATLTIDNFSPQATRAIEDLVMPHMPEVNEPPNMMRLAALSAKRKLQVTK